MHYYAYVIDGVVIEIITPMTDENGDEIPVEQRYHPDFVKELVDITNVSPRPEQSWTYDGATFLPPITP
ncbi:MULTISPECIES: hypothetical protein [unclassified Achromobacter]|uniref:hypothetical protein n=1 Tax=unclassified Achromobacter TaxID=2626865 RepID=UPI000B515F16|nr:MULTISPECIES: hypothetical protein [unclassified Achromobacter]OWT69201.1 hypothetical protein CEY05_28660 [Achromobacter sp. HZ34]OWT70606.1 hypothetical protein CEY04_27490 [Achromobacter sp. HZ28]